jgi:oligosaccharide repeat unit polymerase
MNSALSIEPRPIRWWRSRAREGGLHSGLNLPTTGLLAGLLLPGFYGFGMGISLALPLALLLGLTGQRFVDLIVHSSQRDVFAPTVLIAFYFTIDFGFRALYVNYTGFSDGQLGINPYADYLPQALWCACLGYVSFSIGFSSGWGKMIGSILPKRHLSWPRAMPTNKILLTLGIGAASSAYLFSIGVKVGEYSNPEFLHNPPPGLPVLLEAALYLGWVVICVSLIAPQRIVGRRIAWPLLFLTIVLLLVRVAMKGSKESLILPILQALIVFNYLRRRLRAWELAAITLPTLLVAFGAVNFYRFVAVGQLGGSPKSIGDLASRVSSLTDYFGNGGHVSGQSTAFEQLMLRNEGVDSLALVMKYTPNPFPYAYGKDLVTLPLTFIPRRIWPEKPVDMVGHNFEHQYMGMAEFYIGFNAIHIISDLYRNFNLFGVIGGMLAVGTALRFFYRFADPASRNAAGVYLYAALLPSLGRFLEGDMGTVIVMIIRSCALVAAIGLLVGVRLRRNSRNEPIPNYPPPSAHSNGVRASETRIGYRVAELRD